jgi:hypothetical protein
MHYVKQFHINGVDTKQVACIELHGKPNAATEGAVGVLGMDVSSPTHEVYKCVAVNGSVYTWELLSAGMSIISAKETGEGALAETFLYKDLIIPDGYIIKSGDLILDREGYLYRVIAIGVESCETTYCGTHIGGMASGDKDLTLTVDGGKLRLVTESGAVVSEVDNMIADGETIHREASTGRARVIAIKTVNGGILHFFVGTKAEYNALTDDQKKNMFALITDDAEKNAIYNRLTAIEDGTKAVGKAEKVSPSVTETITYCDEAGNGVDCVLEENSLYHVTVFEVPTGRHKTSFTLFVGSLGSGVKYPSTIGGSAIDDVNGLSAMYKGVYEDENFKMYVMQSDPVDASGHSFYPCISAHEIFEIKFVKIADFPT